ncbi:MAG: dihydroorotate dehydrogenase electron transfer subunit [Magnetococcus sp. MYC-9]
MIRRIQGRVVENRNLHDSMWFLRLHAPGLEQAQAGQFIQLTCGPGLTVPRPFSIWDSQPTEQCIDLLYRVVGKGSRRMTEWQPGFTTPLLGPLGCPFMSPPAGTQALLVAGGVGLAPLDFFARQLAAQGIATTLLWGIESESPLPVAADPERETLSAGLALNHLQRLGVYSRLASLTPRPGFFQGFVTELAAEILQKMEPGQRRHCRLYTCGPEPMMAALAQVAERFALQGEASLEAHMACGFGGCVGCVARIREHGTDHYRRVCMDGPVFPLQDVDWPAADRHVVDPAESRCRM